MKKSLVFLTVLTIGSLCFAGGNKAAGEGGRLKALQERIDKDSTSGALTQNDADQLKREAERIQKSIDNPPRGGKGKNYKSPVNGEIERLEKSIERKENYAKSQGAASASPSAAAR